MRRVPKALLSEGDNTLQMHAHSEKTNGHVREKKKKKQVSSRNRNEWQFLEPNRVALCIMPICTVAGSQMFETGLLQNRRSK